MYTKVGIIGAGTMGIGITVDLLLHGIQTVLVDISEQALEKAKREIVQTARFAPLLNKALPVVSEEQVCSLVIATTDLKHVEDCEFIVENIPEQWALKEPLYRQLDRICRPDVIFGVNTSAISITKVAGVTHRPDKVIGMHFMNPVYLKPSIEVIRGYHTSERTVNEAEALLAQLDKDAIVVNDLTGFVSNRISHLFMNEAAFVVADGVATAKQVDEIFKKCFGHKMGPLETADLIGLDTVMDSLNVLYQEYQDPKFRCSPYLKKMVEAGRLGRKVGAGFYDYTKQRGNEA